MSTALSASLTSRPYFRGWEQESVKFQRAEDRSRAGCDPEDSSLAAGKLSVEWMPLPSCRKGKATHLCYWKEEGQYARTGTQLGVRSWGSVTKEEDLTLSLAPCSKYHSTNF